MKKNKSLLLVDDDNYLVQLLSHYLLSEGFLVNTSDSVKNALVIIKHNKPDLIISDIMMKRLDGYDFIKILKKDKVLLDIPFIFLTAKGMTNDRIRGYNLGCHSYIAKPFDPKELLSIVNNIFKRIENFQLYNMNHLSFYSKIPDYITSFTYREKQILMLLLQGFMNKEIAFRLNLGVRNIEKYITRLLKKTNTRNRTELVKLYITFKQNSILDKGE
uniref:TctD-like protein n=1 Tax=Pleonosporium borreri TaxID=2575635 RepID=A0A4D6WVU1_9FLOR|nr:hypothetical protein [Pleonosporium borreri]